MVTGHWTEQTELDMNPDDYDWIILVGSDAMKYYTKLSSVTEYSGKRVEEKFLPIINPAMLAFKPEAKKVWEDGKQSILEYINDEKEDVVIDSSIAFGIQDTEEANDFIRAAIAEECEYIALDSETTGLYPRDVSILNPSKQTLRFAIV